MVSVSANCRADVQPSVDAHNRPFRLEEQLPASGVLLTRSGREGVRGGCNVHQLGRDVGVCVPADIHDPPGPFKDVGGGVHGPSRGPILAKAALVSAATSPAGGRSKGIAADARSSPNAEVQGKVSRREGYAFNCMDAIKQRYMQAGLSGQTAELVARGRRDAILRVYSSRLRPFVQWCERHTVRPDRASIHQIAEFLKERFDSGLQASTVRGYLSAILTIHIATPQGEAIKGSTTLRLLIEGRHNSAPPRRKLWPEWDLGVVLNALNHQLFEPMLSTTIRDAAIKTAFLIAIASGRRASEIHALAVGNHMVFSRRGVTMYFRPKFLAKINVATFKLPLSLSPNFRLLLGIEDLVVQLGA